MISRKNILVAPLNWGIGHATRCIPIINELITCGFNPILASDGEALSLLKKEFPNLESIKLPSYQIKYPKKGTFFKIKLISRLPLITRAINQEYNLTQKLIEKYALCGIISDNRLGVRSNKVPSVIITHQLNVLSGATTFLSSYLHRKFINKFDECWIPDEKEPNSLAEQLSYSKKIKNKRYVGFLSRFKQQSVSKKYDLLVLLSGVEPMREILEKKLIAELKNYSGKVLFIKGKIEQHQQKKEVGNITFYNFLLSDELECAINESELIIARSGYSTIMDLAKLGKKAFFIPTSGQSEQEYLARNLKQKGIAPFSSEKNFKIGMLQEVESYKGFEGVISLKKKDLFNLFKRK